MDSNVGRRRARRGLILGFATVFLVGVGLSECSAQCADLPKTVASAPCTKAPTIDGVLGEDEWKEATTIKLDMPMVQLKPVALKDKRACELRVMNTANALYVALWVPNAAMHKSLEPIELDMASLAFCQGKDVAKGDDRKVLAPGLYVDKYVDEPGKDKNDPQQDGRGAVAYDKGHYTFEWAVPLDSRDPNDLRAKPGDEFRFNIAFFDHFTTDLKDTQVGGLFGADLPVSAKKQWSITILDEGRPEPQVDHLKYNLRWTRDDFLKQTVTGRIAPDQLTATKLERLMHRYAGKEWLPTRLKHLDQPESEKADVLRGLRTYVAASAENARTFTELYAKLPVERQALRGDIVKQLTWGEIIHDQTKRAHRFPLTNLLGESTP